MDNLVTVQLFLFSIVAVDRVWVHSNLKGRRVVITKSIQHLNSIKSDNRIPSLWAIRGDWELYKDKHYENIRLTISEGQTR